MEKISLIATLNHPSYVYSCKFIPIDAGLNNIFIITACFDS